MLVQKSTVAENLSLKACLHLDGCQCGDGHGVVRVYASVCARVAGSGTATWEDELISQALHKRIQQHSSVEARRALLLPPTTQHTHETPTTPGILNSETDTAQAADTEQGRTQQAADTLQSETRAPGLVLVVGVACSRADVSKAIGRVFTHQIEVEAPTPEEHAVLLRGILEDDVCDVEDSQGWQGVSELSLHASALDSNEAGDHLWGPGGQGRLTQVSMCTDACQSKSMYVLYRNSKVLPLNVCMSCPYGLPYDLGD